MICSNKKIFLSIILIPFLSFAKTPEVVDFNSGVVALENIMTNDETGVLAYNKKNIKFAESKNLSKDLDTKDIANFFGCKTLIGQSFLEETLKNPVSPKDQSSIVFKRQAVIKALVENPDFKKEVEDLISQSKEHEQAVVELMSDYFKGESCPELKNLEIIKEQNPVLYPLFKYLTFSKEGKTLETALKLVGFGGAAYGTYFYGNLTRVFSKKIGWKNKNIRTLSMITAYFGILSGFQGYQVSKDYLNAFKKRNKLHSLHKLINFAEKFEQLYEKYGVEGQFRISDIKDKDGISVVENLKSSRYKDNRSYLFMTPFVHTFLYKLYDNQKHLAEVFACVAEMDVYNAIANKIIDSEDKNAKVCFAEFLDSNQPEVKAKDFWNVLVDENVVVTNNLCENKHMIISGPNAGGKTTSIRSILQNILLGQTFGVAAASNFEFTPFDVVHTYIHISDDLIGGLSLFASEVKRAKEVSTRLKTLNSDEKYFFALDELFTGTASENGEQCACKFIDKISGMPNSLFMYATHFDKLKDLGNSSNYCNNYKVDAPTKNIDGSFNYPFTLSLGASDINIAMDIAENADLF